MLEKDSQKLEIEIINYNNSLSSSSDLEEQKTSGNHSGTYHKSGVGMGEPTRKQQQSAKLLKKPPLNNLSAKYQVTIK